MERTVGLIAIVALLAGCNNEGVQVTSPDAGGGEDVRTVDVSTAVDLGTTPDMPATVDLGQTTDTGQGGGEDGGTDMPSDMGPSTASAGCVDGAGLPEGENTFMLEGLDRRYVLRLPENYTRDRQWPLIFALHGNGGTPDYWDGTAAGRDIREEFKTDAILVLAHAIDNQWRDYSMDASTYPARIEQELAYFDKIVTDAQNELCIDTSAMFSMGFSGGGSFSGVLGCRRTDIRAIAVGGSVVYFDEANCIGKPAAWVAISEGDLSAGREAYLDFFRETAGCDATSMDASPDTCVAFDNCDDGTPVHFCNHPGGHEWPAFGASATREFFNQFVTPQQ